MSKSIADWTFRQRKAARISRPDRFNAVTTEDLIPLLMGSGADPAWTSYVDKRCGGLAK